MTVIMLNSGAVLLLTCAAFFAYEFYTFRQVVVMQLSTLGQITATNSSAAIAFHSEDDANETLNALKAEEHIVAACLYDINGRIFARYPLQHSADKFPTIPGGEGYQFKESYLEGFQPVVHGSKKLGTLYLKSDLGAIQERFKLYSLIVVLIIIFSSLLAYLLSRYMQKRISRPILSLAQTAKTISHDKDYSVRAVTPGKDEVGLLTDAFNQMLSQIEEQNQTVEQKVKELQVTNTDLDNFIYTASHDLKAPISNIEGLVTSLKDEFSVYKNETIESLLEMVDISILRFKNTIKDLTEIAKIQKETESEVYNVNIEALVTEILLDLRETISSEDAKIILELNGSKELKFSKKNIRSIIYNLVSNALKYRSPDRKPAVTISSKNIDNYYLFVVQDNGLGLDSNQKDRVFTMFKRFHNHVEGTGIGLYIVKRMVENSGGKIEVESEKGVGSSFKVYLKLNNL